MRTFIQPSKGDSPYSPFHSPFLNGESPFTKGEWASRNKIPASKMVNAFTLGGKSLFSKDEWNKLKVRFYKWTLKIDSKMKFSIYR